MDSFFVFQLKVSAYIAVFYLFYRLLLSKNTFHRMNRIVLLITVIASLILPWCIITIHHTELVTDSISTQTVLPMTTTEKTVPRWQFACLFVYILGCIVCLGKMAFSILRIKRLISSGQKKPQPDGSVVVIVPQQMAPFSWLKYIILDEEDYADEHPEILLHEQAHVRLKHSYDVLLIELFTTLQWYNPILWLLRRDLREIHEFEADDQVLRSGISAKQYQYLLIQKALAGSSYTVANSFTHSSLKNRINMMIKRRTNQTGRYKGLYLLPIVAISLVLQARTVTEYRYQNPVKPPKSQVTHASDSAKKYSIYVDKRLVSQEELNQINPDEIESMNVDKKTSSITVVTKQANKSKDNSEPKAVIQGKSLGEKASSEMSIENRLPDNVHYYVNGKLVSAEESKQISPNSIKSINIEKKENLSNIYITTKE